MQLDRHQVVQLEPSAWSALISARPDLEAHPDVADWVALGRPLVSRGRLCSDSADRVPLGLPLPPSMGKQRLSFAVNPDAVKAINSPPRLADASHLVSVEWLAPLARLVAMDRDVRCFGSLAWEHLTGLPYLTATSDIDLLWRVATREDADRLTAAIAPIDARAPMRIDGEILAPNGLSIHWREWAGGASELLAKRCDGHRMVKRTEVFS